VQLKLWLSEFGCDKSNDENTTRFVFTENLDIDSDIIVTVFYGTVEYVL
jgi:hypothetical protein